MWISGTGRNAARGRFLREEAGMTMALAVIMIVLIGVMGAGLLVFVQRDLESVLEVNRGQRAAELADTGVQAAQRQLLLSSFPNRYNDPTTATPGIDPSTDPANSEWAFNSTAVACGTLSSGSGKCISTPDGNVRVTIRYLPPPPTALQRTSPIYAPEALPTGASDYRDGRDYFRVESDGVSAGARRKVQAILVTQPIGLPQAYFATRDIHVGGSATTINNVSLFASGNVDGIREGMLTGKDLAYGSWLQPPYNDKARLGQSPANDPAAAGVGAEGSVTYDPASYHTAQKTDPALTTDRYERVDFDSVSSLSGGYRFCRRGSASCGWPSTSASQPADVITYPFNFGAALNADFLQSLAEEQIRPGPGPAAARDNYYTAPGGTSYTIDESNFYQITPRLSSVYVVRFTGPTKGSVTYNPNQPTGSLCLAGTILVINGDLRTSSSGDRCFDGIVSVQDPNNLGTLQYTNIGNFALNGYANIEGTMTIQGSVDPILGNDVLNQPGYHDIRVWSWRECYSQTCT
jgi:hypothetical protein